MAITIKDIAKVAGVSHTTVSRALNGHPAISTETVERIKLLAEELGYVPSAAARGLKTNRSHVLGVIVHRIEDPFLAEVLKGIEDTLHVSEYSLFLAATRRDPKREQRVIQVMGERRVDGVIISSTQINFDRIRQLNRFGIPFVLINNQAMDEPDTYSIYHDDAYGSSQIMQHLLDLGHERIAYLGYSLGGRTNAKRLEGYEIALRQSGLRQRSEYIASATIGTPAGGAQGIQALLGLKELPTAVMCYNDMMAIGAIQAIQRAGLHVPKDISITGFDNIDLSAYITPALTTFHQPKYELGTKAAAMMLRVLNDDTEISEPDVQVLRGELTLRESTAPPNLGCVHK